MSKKQLAINSLLAAMVGVGCGDDSSYSDSTTFGDDGIGGDTSGDGDTNGDGDGDGDGDDGVFSPNVDIPPPPPEQESEGDFRLPKVSGRFVYSASRTTDRLAVIDSEDLFIDVVDVAEGPTAVVAIPGVSQDEGYVAVLGEVSDELAFVYTDADGVNTVELRPVSDNTNALVASPDGNWVVVYHDVDVIPEEGEDRGGGATDQELSFASTAPGGEIYAMTVGTHPRDVVFAPDSSVAWVVTNDGINQIEIADLGVVGIPDLIPVTVDQAVDPAKVEVKIATVARQALARTDGAKWLCVTDLATSLQIEFDLGAVPTDVDIAEDAGFALVTIPSIAGSGIAELALPADLGSTFVQNPIPDEYLGVSELSADGNTAVLYTTVLPEYPEPPDHDPRQRVTVAHRSAGEWSDYDTFFVESPVVSAGMAPDGRSVQLVHAAAPELNPAAPWPYTLVDLVAPFPVKKVQMVEADPGPTFFGPDGHRAVVLLRDDDLGIQKADLVDLQTFIVDSFTLGSPPEGAGWIESTQKFFISQEHPSGRITFIDADGQAQTITGYELNDTVKD